ncbi:MAG: VCBS repeat-containing protein, partial [Planctomycetes bacterium]|nr:VCBS repeat-containing protein [Planctomycetota bacterium]
TGNFVGNPTTQLPVICKDAGDVAIVDLDGDGDNDLIVCDGGTVSPGVTRFDNIAGGLFLVGTNAIDDAYTIATGDYNGDGFLDWAIGGTTNGTDETRILWGSASGSWTVFNSTVIGGLPEAAAHWLRARDMDGDGDLDLLYAGASQNGVLINDGSGNFSLSPIATTSSPGLPNPRLDAVDFDQDGDLDVVHLVRPGPQSYCVVEVNNGNTQFTKSWYLPLRGSPSTPASGGYCLVADLDGDGDDDIAAGGYPSTILVNDN